MYNNVQLAVKFLRYYVSASNGKGHGMHSPFVFNFILNVLNNAKGFDPGTEIEQLRTQLESDQRVLSIEDHGAGSRTGVVRNKTVSQVAATSLKPRKLAQLLFRLAKFYEPRNIIELGTSLGLTTAYFSRAVPEARIISIEGSHAVADIAEENFRKLGCDHIQLMRGNFDAILPGVLEKESSVDLAYIDGNHRYKPTMEYFSMLLDRSHENTILVFDDIHWSAEMEKAWNEIRSHIAVKYTIDIFFLGFVFFRPEFKVKQDFMIRF